MKQLLLLLPLAVLLTVGCDSSEGSRVAKPKGLSEREQLTTLWAKVGPLEVSRTTTPEQLIAALGTPVAHNSDPESYSWGKFDAADEQKHVTRRTMFFAEFEPAGLKTFKKTEPVLTEGVPFRYRDGTLMSWDEKEKKFVPRGRKAQEQAEKAKPQP